MSLAIAEDNQDQVAWRIRFLEAAVVQGSHVLLGEVAVPMGDIPEEQWREMANRELWPSPEKNSKPVNMTRPRLQEAVMSTMRDLAPYCLFPGSMALQRGGRVIQKGDIQKAVYDALTPATVVMQGEAVFRDFRIPSYVFFSHAAQKLAVEPQKKVTPGRVNFRIVVKELDGTPVQRISASAFLDLWANVPSVTSPLNKDDILNPDTITYTRTNLAYLREKPWDGRGGPWKIQRPIGANQVIYQSDLRYIPTITKGTTVTLLFESKTVRLSVRGEALADGVTGESIPVKNLQSKKEVYGVVRDQQTVLITGY